MFAFHQSCVTNFVAFLENVSPSSWFDKWKLKDAGLPDFSW
jgi:hypothetical protein